MKVDFLNNLKKKSFKWVPHIMYYGFLGFVILVTVLIFVSSPAQQHFHEAANNDVWFGDNWSYVDDSGQIDTTADIITRNEHYMHVDAKDSNITLTKVMDFKPSDEDFFCFRVRAQSVKLYVNGEIWYDREFPEQYKTYTMRMYLLHQIPVAELKPGDVITLSLSAEEVKNFIIQFPLGNC